MRENDSPNWQGSLTRWRNWKLVRLILCLSTSWQLEHFELPILLLQQLKCVFLHFTSLFSIMFANFLCGAMLSRRRCRARMTCSHFLLPCCSRVVKRCRWYQIIHFNVLPTSSGTPNFFSFYILISKTAWMFEARSWNCCSILCLLRRAAWVDSSNASDVDDDAGKCKMRNDNHLFIFNMNDVISNGSRW